MKSTTGSLYILILFIIILPANLLFAQDAMKKHEDLATEFIEAAKSFRNSGDYKNALIMLKQAYLLYPDSPMVLFSIARSYEEIGECTKAYEWFSKTLVHHQSKQLKPKHKEKTTSFLTSKMDCLPFGDAKLRHSNRELLADSAKLYLNKEYGDSEKLLEVALLQIETTEAYIRLAILAFLDKNCEKMQYSIEKASSFGKNIEEYAGITGYLKNNLNCYEILVTEKTEKPKDPEEVKTETKDPVIVAEKTKDNTEKKNIDSGKENNNGNEHGIGQVMIIDEGPSPLAWITGGVGLVSIGVAIAVYAGNKDVQTQYNEEWSNLIVDENKANGLKEDIQRNEKLFNAFLWGGVAMGVTSTALFIFTGGKTEKEKISITPIFSPSTSGLAIEGSF